MTGAWSKQRGSHSRLELRLQQPCDATPAATGGFSLFFNDQRSFGTITVSVERAELEAKLASLGPSWLAAPSGADGASDGSLLSLADFLGVVRRQCDPARRGGAGGHVPVAKFLMDQSKTAGIGNYLLSETLHRAHVWPWAACADLDEAEWSALHAAAAEVICESYESQRAASRAARAADADADAVPRTRGAFTFPLLVFRRDRTDAGLEVRRSLGPHGRSVFWVPELQRRGRPPDVADEP